MNLPCGCTQRKRCPVAEALWAECRASYKRYSASPARPGVYALWDEYMAIRAEYSEHKKHVKEQEDTND